MEIRIRRVDGNMDRDYANVEVEIDNMVVDLLIKEKEEENMKEYKPQVLRTINLGDHLGKVDVILDNIDGKGGCFDCYLNDVMGCNGHRDCKRITGIDCTCGPCYFKKHIPYKWIQCTPDNLRKYPIQIGDEVKTHKNASLVPTVSYIINNFPEPEKIVLRFSDGSEGVYLIAECKKKVVVN
jgi:hypothetical protein